ncbi:MAG: hypothetical protein FJ299_05180 [Planctomycetes bacterium]|nr:hypothetical protein [Planctomycetota bacterium]
MSVRALAVAVLAACLAGGFQRAQVRDPVERAARVQQFEQDVRPLLASRCFACHGPETTRVKGGLRISGRAALLAGGDSGPALVSGDPAASLLIRAVRYEHPDIHMPPKERLSVREIDALVEWVAAGAEWPEEGAHAPPAPESSAPAEDPAASYVVVVSTAPPTRAARRQRCRRECRRRIHRCAARRGRPVPQSAGQPARARAPSVHRSARATADSGGDPRVRAGRLARSLGAPGRPTARASRVRRAHGAALARPGAFRADQRLRARH